MRSPILNYATILLYDFFNYCEERLEMLKKIKI
jgi:hypothetical protein